MLLSWILVEAAILNSPVSSYSLDQYDLSLDPMSAGIRSSIRSKENRALRLADIRVALCFIVLINVAFFGTGNVASVASFEISSVYRFITIFNLCFQCSYKASQITKASLLFCCDVLLGCHDNSFLLSCSEHRKLAGNWTDY